MFSLIVICFEAFVIPPKVANDYDRICAEHNGVGNGVTD